MKWRAHPADVLPLWVAEMDVKLPPTVADALRRAIDDGDTGIPMERSMPKPSANSLANVGNGTTWK